MTESNLQMLINVADFTREAISEKRGKNLQTNHPIRKIIYKLLMIFLRIAKRRFMFLIPFDGISMQNIFADGSAAA